MKFKLSLFLILYTLIGYSQELPISSPKILVKIPLGESILIENHTINFIKVIEDSRCPKDANCIWAGRAKILVEVTYEEETEKREIVFGKVNPGESDSLELINKPSKNVLAYQLNPYPTSEDTPDSKKYILLVATED